METINPQFGHSKGGLPIKLWGKYLSEDSWCHFKFENSGNLQTQKALQVNDSSIMLCTVPKVSFQQTIFFSIIPL